MNDTKNAVDLSKGNVTKLLISLALPAIAAQVINVLYNMVDRMYIGHIDVIGSDALTGVGVTMPIIMCVSAFAALVSMGGAPRASIFLGRNDKDMAEKILGNCFVMLIIVAIILTFGVYIFAPELVMFLGASEITAPYGIDYIRIYALGTFFVQLTLGLNAFVTSQGFAKTSMLTVAIGAILNIILDPIFIFVFNMGVKGAAWATIISQAVSMIWVIKFLSSNRSYLRLRKANFRLNPKIFIPCLSLGLSPFIMQFSESIIVVCFNTSLALYGGDIAVGAMTILSSVMQFSMLPLQGLTQGSQPIISYNYGAKNMDRVKNCFKSLLIISLGYSTLLWAVAVFAPMVFISIFTNDLTLSEYSITAMRIYMGMSLIFGAQIACQQTFIALGKAKQSIFLALWRKVILLIPLIYILPNFVEDKAMGVFLTEPIADTIAVLTTVIMFAYNFKKILSAK